MRSSLVLLLALAVFMTLFIPAMEAASRRRGRGGRKSASSVGRGRKQGRRGKVISGRGRQQGRRGRTNNYDSDAASADANGVDGGEEELHNGCDWKKNIGDFLTFCKWRKWCADEQGVTDFGPYGGVPEECPLPGDEGGGEE
jgi:hypothetical protein